MKKMIALIGAVATSFGLFAETTSYNISFEGADSSKGVDISAMTFTPDGEQWTGDAPLDLGTYAKDGPGYVYGEGAFARRSNEFDEKVNNLNFLKLETGKSVLTCATDGNVFVDQVVKFTGFEEAPVLAADQKMAVWASEFPVEGSEDDETTTNLWVSCGKVANGTTTQINLPLNVANFQLDKWYRLTAKMIGNVYDNALIPARAGFIVFIDGVQVGSLDPAAKSLTDMDGALTAKANAYMAEGKLFLSYTEDATFSTVNYQGIGAIDDLIVDSVGPDFAADVTVGFTLPAGILIDYITADGKVVDADGEGNYVFAKNSAVVAYFKADKPSKRANPTSKDLGQIGEDGTITLTEADVKAENAIIKVDSTYFFKGEIEQALLAVHTGNHKVNFLTDVEYGDYAFPEGTEVDITDNGDSTCTWEVAIPDEGELVNAFGVEANKEIIVDCGDDADLLLEGEIAAGGSITADDVVLSGNLTVAGSFAAGAIDLKGKKITLTGDGEVIVPTALADGDIVVDPAEGTLGSEVVAGGVRYFVQSDAPDPVAMIGDKGYATLGEAFNAAQDNDTVVLQKDIVLADDEASALSIESKTITVDLNGKTYSYWTGYCWRLKSATVTINDTSVEQTGSIIKRDDATMIEIDANSKVIFNAGLIAMGTASKTGSTGGCFKVLGELEVNGGTITSYVGGYARSYSFSIRGDGKVAVKNGAKVVTPVQFSEGGQASNLVVAEDSTSLFGNDWSAYCSAGQIMDDSQDGTATPYFVGAKIEITYVYGEGTAPATANKATFAAYAAARTFTLTQPTAPSGKVFDAWTSSETDVTFDGDDMTIPAEFAKTFTVTATYKSTTPDYPPEWPDAKDYTEKFAAWSTAYDLTGVDLTTDAAKNAFLMNVDPKGTLPTLTIDSIDVDNAEQTATIVVSAGEKNLGEINGVLYVDVTDELGGEWATSAFDLATEIDETTGKATFEVDMTEGQFMKAKVGFTTPTVE